MGGLSREGHKYLTVSFFISSLYYIFSEHRETKSASTCAWCQFMVGYKTLPCRVTDKYAFIYSSKKPHNSLLHYVSECKQLAMKNEVSIVLAAHDIADLIGAALVLELSHLYGPSVESYLLAHHKYYSHKHLDNDPISYVHVSLDATKWVQRSSWIWNHVLVHACSAGAIKVNSMSDLAQTVDSCKGAAAFKRQGSYASINCSSLDSSLPYTVSTSVSIVCLNCYYAHFAYLIPYSLHLHACATEHGHHTRMCTKVM